MPDTPTPFSFDLPEDAPPQLEAVALLGAGLAELRATLADLAEQHFALREQVAAAPEGAGTAGSGAPAPLRWADLDRPTASALWLWLVAWVGWLADRFPVTADIPACWPTHPPLVEELTALAAAWHAAYDPRAHPEAPLRWMEAFARSRQRLRDWDEHTRCRTGAHTAPGADLAWPADWREHALDTAEADLRGRATPAPPAADPAGTPTRAAHAGRPAGPAATDDGSEPA